jgi:hypothetical protein
MLEAIFTKIRLGVVRSYFYMLIPLTANTIFSKPPSAGFFYETLSHFSDNLVINDELRDSGLS